MNQPDETGPEAQDDTSLEDLVAGEPPVGEESVEPIAAAAASAEEAGVPGLPDEEMPAADPAVSEVEAAALEATDADARRRQLSAVVEALLFASDEPVTIAALRKVVEDSTADELKSVLYDIREAYDHAGRGIALCEMAGGFLICTRDAYAPWVEKMIKGKRRVRLSRAGLETIAVVAYKQPISRGEIERIRGVDCGGVLGTLVERDLIMIKGRDPGPGKPLLYGTTQEFLNYFGLNRLGELPRLDELSTLAARNPTWSDYERARFQKHGVETIEMDLDGSGAEAARAEAAEGSAAEPGAAARPTERVEAAAASGDADDTDDAYETAPDEARPV